MFSLCPASKKSPTTCRSIRERGQAVARRMEPLSRHNGCRRLCYSAGGRDGRSEARQFLAHSGRGATRLIENRRTSNRQHLPVEILSSQHEGAPFCHRLQVALRCLDSHPVARIGRRLHPLREKNPSICMRNDVAIDFSHDKSPPNSGKRPRAADGSLTTADFRLPQAFGRCNTRQARVATGLPNLVDIARCRPLRRLARAAGLCGADPTAITGRPRC